MDSTSPSHHGFQVWEGIELTKIDYFLRHIDLELSITQTKINQSVNLVKKAMGKY